jgi:phasin family protein
MASRASKSKRKPGPHRAAAIAPGPAAEAAADTDHDASSPRVSPNPEPKGPPMNTNSFETAGFAAREQIEKASQTAYKSFEEMSKLQKDNWEAVVAASQIWAKGAEVIGKAWMGLAQETLETAATTAKAMVGVKTLREAVDLQADFAKGNFDKFVAESTKMSETVVKVANDAMEPITARVNVSVEKIFKPLAA